MKDIRKTNTKKLDFNIWCELYATKQLKKITYRFYVLINGVETMRDFFTKTEAKEFINAMKFYKIPVTMYHSNYNCSYMDLPF